MYRINLTDAERAELDRRAREPECKSRTRPRLEAVRLSDAGWRVPQIAQHLRFTEPTVRIWIKTFLAEGFDGLPDEPHLGQAAAVTPAMMAALVTVIDQGERTWTAGQCVTWLAENYGVQVTTGWMGSLLRRAGLSYKRTRRRLKHKQDPVKVAAKREELEALEQRGGTGS